MNAKEENFIRNVTRICKMALAPLAMYFTAFCALTYPLMAKFSSHFFCDAGDGLMNVWNLWWVNKAVTQLHTSPWFTTYLHYPYGISLLGQTLNIFNGYIGIFLLKCMPLLQAHNFIVVFSFVMSGWTMFLLAHYLTRTYYGSLVAGYIFTFSSYHFAHAQGHLNLVSMEWIPLFILYFFTLITRPSVRTALAAAVMLYAVLLCDYYYFFYCIISATVIILWQAIQQRSISQFVRREFLIPIAAFGVLAFITSGVLTLKLLYMNMRDPFVGAHNAHEFSADLLAAFIPGAHWRFASMTQPYWSKLPGNTIESCVFIGISVCILAVFLLTQRRQAQTEGFWLWSSLAIVFFLLSLGPALLIGGKKVTGDIMPYAWLETLIPSLKLSGCPSRMMIMVTLFSAILCSAAVGLLSNANMKSKIALSAILLLLLVEHLPSPIPSTQVTVPAFVEKLKRKPDTTGIIDATSQKTLALYYQTVHEKPMAFGYTARTPTSVKTKGLDIIQLLQKEDFSQLRSKYNIGYLIARPSADAKEVVYKLE